MYEYEEVPEKEGMALAKQINAFFQTTTAKEKNGSIDQLFMNFIFKFIINYQQSKKLATSFFSFIIFFLS